MALVPLAPTLSSIFSLGVVGIGLASWLGDDDSEGESEQDEEFGMDDDFGMDGFDDDFGGMDDMGEGGTGASTTELEHRIEDLESEIANVSSTANTVRSENEQISEKVDEVQENVRKLLEIYEMVTRGVNPFVDDVSSEAGMGGQGSFGLFGDAADEEEADDDEDLDSDIADADAEDFFDDDAFDDFDDEFGDEEFDDFDEAGFDEDAEGFDVDDESEDEDSGGGTSFEELKAEYESGEADWADEDLDDDLEPDEENEDIGFDDVEEDAVEDEDDEIDLFQEDDLTGDAETEDVLDDEEDTVEDPSASEAGSMDAVEAVDDDQTETDDETDTGFQFGAAATAAAQGAPHLEVPPDGYLADVVILEWLDHLVEEFGARNAVRAINYYERIDWIGEPMRDHLFEVLLGITDAEYLYRDEFGTTDLSMDDHLTSLDYIEDLAGGQLDRELGNRLDTLQTDGI